jgi:hypothetical protein
MGYSVFSDACRRQNFCRFIFKDTEPEDHSAIARYLQHGGAALHSLNLSVPGKFTVRLTFLTFFAPVFFAPVFFTPVGLVAAVPFVAVVDSTAAALVAKAGLLEAATAVAFPEAAVPAE